MTKPLLSICIATYNRAQYIGETLESIISQATDEVEIIVVDGASTDGTWDVVAEYIKICRQLRYIRLASKGGVDHDYDRAVEFSAAEYCWLFTDDDLLKPGAIAEILLEIQKQYSLIVVNSEVWNKDFSTLLSESHLSDDAQTVYEPNELDKFFIHCVKYMSFIGAVVIKKDIWQERNRRLYMGTEFVHIGVIFQSLLPTPIRVIKKPLIRIRYGNAQWVARKFDIWTIKWPQLLWSFAAISQSCKQDLAPKEPWRDFKTLFLYRSLSAYDTEVCRKLVSAYSVSCTWSLLAEAISRFPIRWARFIFRKWCLLRGKPYSLTYYDILQQSHIDF